jgi:TPR repeat protein
MKHFVLFAALGALSFSVGAQCKTSLPLQGIASVQTCDRKTETCVDAWKAAGKYAEKIKGNDDPAILNLVVNASPWRFYDAQFRILTVEEIAGAIKPSIAKGVERVALIASWTAIRPDAHTPSLAEQVGKLLGSTPVTGEDGFLWISRDGTLRTTRQAATVMQGGRYEVAEGGEVLVSLAVGWPANFLELFVKEKNAQGIAWAAAGWDIYMLCPERALQAFEYAAQLGHPIAAYNAALMRLDRGGQGDLDAAKELLLKASNAGDKKAQERLQLLNRAAR